MNVARVAWLCSAAAVCLQLVMCDVVRSSPLIALVYRVEEDCETGTVLADIKTDSGLSQRYADRPAVVDQLRFDMLTSPLSADSGRHVNVDERTGLVRSATTLDRDEICPSAASCTLYVDVAVYPGAYFQLIKVCTTSATAIVYISFSNAAV